MQNSHYHVFSLPTELLDSLTPRNLVNRVPSREPTPDPVPSASKSGSRACNVCQGVIFLNVDEQRTHFRSDWHRYNVKTRLAGRQTVNETAFSQLLDGLEDSLSGSASSDEDDDDSDAVQTLLSKTRRLATRSPSPDFTSKHPPLTAISWFHSPPATQIGIYRSLLPLKSEPRNYLDELRKLQRPVAAGRKWAMFMVAGGHFAGAVVRVSPSTEDEEDEVQGGRKKKQKKPKPDTEVLLHKTFHRYTTRRKQGGSQSTNDNAKGAAKSAGAQLRRYGEQALRDDIRGLLQEWSEEIADCERIWVRASTSNKRIFYDYEGANWTKDDERLRGFPFPTRRPTQSELARCLQELTRPKLSRFTEEELRAQDEAYLASLPKARPIPQVAPDPEKEKAPKAPKLSKEEELLRDKWNRLLEMVSKNRLDALKSFLEREGPTLGGVNTSIPEWTGEQRATILQLAVSHGHEEVTRWLLEEAEADPTISVPSSKPKGNDEEAVGGASDDGGGSSKHAHRTAYDLAKTKALRDVFRRAAAARPDRWDWFNAAHVPSALTQEMEDERDEKKKVKRKGLKDRIREREAKEKDKPKDSANIQDGSPVHPNLEVKASTNSNRLGGAVASSQGVAGVTPEMRARVERERRARAAEARLNALGRS